MIKYQKFFIDYVTGKIVLLSAKSKESQFNTGKSINYQLIKKVF